MEQVSGTFSVLTISSLSPRASAESEKRLLTTFSSLNPMAFRRTWPRLRPSVATLLGLAALFFLPACVHVNLACTGTCDRGQELQDPEGGGENYVFDPSDILVHFPRCQSIVDLEHKKQQTSFWCWASSTQSVMNHVYRNSVYDPATPPPPPVEQCDLADQVFMVGLKQKRTETGLPSIGCCKAVDGYMALPGENPQVAEESRNICKDGAWPEEVLIKYGFTHDPPLLYPPDDGGLSWAELTGEICNSRPIIFVIRWHDDGGPASYHTGVVRGYRQPQDGSQWVEYHDAGADGFVVMPYEKWFIGVPGEFSHEVDYLNIREQ